MLHFTRDSLLGRGFGLRGISKRGITERQACEVYVEVQLYSLRKVKRVVLASICQIGKARGKVFSHFSSFFGDGNVVFLYYRGLQAKPEMEQPRKWVLPKC